MSESSSERGNQHWFEPIADHLGSAYLRYSFTRGTVQEVDNRGGALALTPGARVLDVGCGPGRHAHGVAGIESTVHGIDISETFVASPPPGLPPGETSSGSMPVAFRSGPSSTP